MGGGRTFREPQGVATWGQPRVQAGTVSGPGRPQECRDIGGTLEDRGDEAGVPLTLCLGLLGFQNISAGCGAFLSVELRMA